MSKTPVQDRPDLEVVLFALVLPMLAPGRLFCATDEYLQFLLLVAVREGLMDGLQIGLDATVPSVQFLISEWLEDGILLRCDSHGGLQLSPKGCEVARGKILSVHNVQHRDYIRRVTVAVVGESIEVVLSEGPVLNPHAGGRSGGEADA
jgi:hypothetical protein